MRATSGELGPVLRGHRQAAALTLEELAELSGVSARAISDMERGHSKGPQSRTIASLAAALRLGPAGRADLLAAASSGRRRPPDGAPGWVVPADDPAFVGRAAELAGARQVLTAPGGGGVVVISGTGGLGKTALAVRVAHEAAADFPGGVIFVALRGLEGIPVATDHAAIRILNGLGIRGRDVPVDPDQRISLLQATLARSRVLVVLDNAADESQVRDLLPRGGPSAALITSRRTQSGLNAVAHVNLSPLSVSESVSLLGRILGSGYTGGRVQLDELARACGHFPLAIRIAANRLLSRPGWTVQTMIGLLSDTELRLDRLAAGDQRIRSAFAVSYDQLNPSEQLVFRRLSLARGPDWSLDAAAVLTDLPPRQVDRQLDSLVELGLVNVSPSERYSFHDLVRLFAGRLQSENDPPEDVATAGDRYRDWLLHTALRAGNLFEPGSPGPNVPPSAPSALVGAFGDAASAEEWLTAEVENWLLAFRETARAGHHRAVIDVAESMHWFSDRKPHLGVWQEVFDGARNAARELGDARLQAVHTNYLCWVYYWPLQDSQTALELAGEAFQLAVRAEDLNQQAWAKYYAAEARLQLLAYDSSLIDAFAAVDLFKRSADAEGYPQALLLCASISSALGRHDDTDRAIHEVFTVLDDPSSSLPSNIVDFTRVTALLTQAKDRAAQQRWDEADEKFRQALSITQRAGLAHREVAVLESYARMLVQCQRTAQAREYSVRLQQVSENIDDRNGAEQARVLLLELTEL